MQNLRKLTIWEQIFDLKKRKICLGILLIILSISVCSCGNSDPHTQNDNTSTMIEPTEAVMKLYINEIEVPVIWEDNSSVKELMEEASKKEIVVSMSMYSDNEQVGSLGRSYTRNDQQITTHNGDIVLYSGSNIVVFYGSNSWAYTRLGKMNISEDEVTEILSKGDVELKLIVE